MDIEEDDYEFEKIVDHCFKNNVIFLNFRYIVDTLDRYNRIELPLSVFKKYVPTELARYVNNCVVEACTKLLKGHTIYVKLPYRMKAINQRYSIVATGRAMKNAPEAKLNMPRELNTKLYRN